MPEPREWTILVCRDCGNWHDRSAAYRCDRSKLTAMDTGVDPVVVREVPVPPQPEEGTDLVERILPSWLAQLRHHEVIKDWEPDYRERFARSTLEALTRTIVAARDSAPALSPERVERVREAAEAALRLFDSGPPRRRGLKAELEVAARLRAALEGATE